MKMQLILILVITRTIDVVEAKLIGVFCWRNNPNPVAKGILLQEFFGQILEIAFGQRNIGCDSELGAAIASYFDVVSKLAGFAIDLDAVVQELFEIGTVKDTITGRLWVIDDEFMLGSSGFSSGGLGLQKRKEANRWYEPTEKRTQQSGTKH